MKYRLQGKQFVHYLHIGKTGGTAFHKAVEPNLITDRYRIILHGHPFKLMDVPGGEKVIFFLRDPISRFASGFYSRQRQGLPRDFNPWRPNEAISFNRFQSPQALAAALSSDDAELREAAHYAMTNIGHVKSHFWDWFKDENYFLSRWADILFIGFQESFDSDFAKLKQILQLPDTVVLPQSDEKTNRSPIGINLTFSETERQNLLEWYAADYQFLDLCKRLLAQENYSTQGMQKLISR
ncbi:sulfotransferase family 2 domain-containing protein [Leptolyngbya sp. AS-A5]|uniref:sulfotransferase family 2 domain-containing protein n=1 Tax=Leptolyngbya sp. AS-A5 TaxID=2933919 RepID=UPI0032982560